MLDVVFGQASDAGRVRPLNEDAVASFVPRSREESDSRGWLFAVADGAGGRNLGEVASARAIRVITESFAQSPENTPPAMVLPALIQAANTSVRQEGLSPERRGHPMTTTIVACALRHDQAVISHVGDSRCYLVRDGKATQLTPDHTWVNEQRTLGLITAIAAEQSEKRHVLTRCLGPEPTVAIDTTTTTLKPGDALVLCTDGLYDAMYPEDIARFAAQDCHAEQIAKDLVAYAVEADGSDNATAQVIQIKLIESVVGIPVCRTDCERSDHDS